MGASFGRLLGADLSAVRIHPAHPAAEALGAQAFTHGVHVAFAPGACAPDAAEGRLLLAHELAHVVQHDPTRPGPRVAPDATHEAEAEAAARAVTAGRPASPLGRVAIAVQRDLPAFEALLQRLENQTLEQRRTWWQNVRARTAAVGRQVFVHDLTRAQRLRFFQVLHPALRLLQRLELRLDCFSDDTRGMAALVRAATPAELQAARDAPDARALERFIKAEFPHRNPAREEDAFGALLRIWPKRAVAWARWRIEAANEWFDDDEAGVFRVLLALRPGERLQLWTERGDLFGFLTASEQDLVHRACEDDGQAVSDLQAADVAMTAASSLGDKALAGDVGRQATAWTGERELRIQLLALGAASPAEEEEHLTRLLELGDPAPLQKLYFYGPDHGPDAPTDAMGYPGVGPWDPAGNSFLGRLVGLGDDATVRDFAQVSGFDQEEVARLRLARAAEGGGIDVEAVYAALEDIGVEAGDPGPSDPSGSPEDHAWAVTYARRAHVRYAPELAYVFSRLGEEELAVVDRLVGATPYDLALAMLVRRRSALGLLLVGVAGLDQEVRERIDAEQPDAWVETLSAWEGTDLDTGDCNHEGEYVERSGGASAAEILEGALRTGTIEAGALLTRWSVAADDGLLQVALAALTEAERRRLRRGFVLASGAERDCRPGDDEALAAWTDLRAQLAGGLGEAELDDALGRALAPAGSEELQSSSERTDALRLLDLRQVERLGRSSSFDRFQSPDDTMEQARILFVDAWHRAAADGEITDEELREILVHDALFWEAAGSTLDWGQVGLSLGETLFKGALAIAVIGAAAGLTGISGGTAAVLVAGLLATQVGAAYLARRDEVEAGSDHVSVPETLLASLGDVAGVSQVIEGITGERLGTGRLLSTEERSNALGEGAGTLVLLVRGGRIFRRAESWGKVLRARFKAPAGGGLVPLQGRLDPAGVTSPKTPPRLGSKELVLRAPELQLVDLRTVRVQGPGMSGGFMEITPDGVTLFEPDVSGVLRVARSSPWPSGHKAFHDPSGHWTFARSGRKWLFWSRHDGTFTLGEWADAGPFEGLVRFGGGGSSGSLPALGGAGAMRLAPVDPGTWVAEPVRLLDPRELAKFEEMVRGRDGVRKTDSEIHAMFEGRLDETVARIRRAVADADARAASRAASEARGKELLALFRRWATKDPAALALLADAGLQRADLLGKLRDIFASRVHREVLLQEFGPSVEVHAGLKIYVRQPDAVQLAMQTGTNRPAEAGMEAFGGTWYKVSGEMDAVVVEPVAGGKARIVAREELKTGRRDAPSRAREQLVNAADLLAEAAAGGIVVRIGVDIASDVSGQLDLASDATALHRTRGPAGKGFDEDLGVTAHQLEGMVNTVMREQGR